MFDIIVSLTFIVAFLPIYIMLAVGIKVSSRGPVFFSTDRVGINRKIFTMFKFRTMHIFNQDVTGQNKTSEGGYIANPKRIFRIGGFLRKSKLDEFPQLINVLLSDISIVGPRPITPAGVEKLYKGEYAEIINIKPGLTCLDSLYDYAHGELFITDNEEYKKKVLPIKLELAKIYIEHRSMILDLKIILRTAYLILAIAILGKKNFPYTKYEQLANKRVLEFI